MSGRHSRMARWSAELATAAVILGASTLVSTPALGQESAAASTGTSATCDKTTRVIGANTSDIVTLDPDVQFTLFSGVPTHAAYETLLMVTGDDPATLKPALATSWELTPEGDGWIFHLRDGVKFASGNPMTADDVKFSFDRLKNLKTDASTQTANFASVDVIDPLTVKVTMVDKAQPLVPWLISTDTSIVDSKVVTEQGGFSGEGADTQDTAGPWLDTHSAGTGPYVLDGWTRNSEITFSRNPNYWKGTPPFERVIIRHIPDAASQLLQIQNGDIDAAFNLGPDQLATITNDPNIQLIKSQALDTMILAITVDPALNEALGNKAARQALLYAIDYDGIIDGLYGGDAVRPLTFVPIPLGGSTEALNEEFGYHEDLDKAKELLAQAGYPDGFTFPLHYASGSAGFGGVAYELIAQKIATDLARVGITAELKPAEEELMRTGYRAGENPATLTFWAPEAMDASVYADPATQRVAGRIRWTVPQEVLDLVKAADGEPDPVKRNALYVEFQKQLADLAALQTLVQPSYADAVRNTVDNWHQNFPASYHVEMGEVTPKC